MRRGLVGIGLALTAALVALASLVSVNRMARQTVQEKHTYGFKGSALSIDVALGEVQIVPGKAGEITVARRLTYGLRRPFVEERIDNGTFRIRDRNCTAPVAFPCHVRWLVQIPRDLFVEVSTQAGSITVQGLSGTAKLVSVSGSVKAVAQSGPLLTLRSQDGVVTAANASSAQVVATSGSGDVSMTFRAPPSLVVGRSETGRVGVLLPDGTEKYRIAATAGGSKTVTAQNDDGARRKIDVRSQKNDISILQSPEN